MEWISVKFAWPHPQMWVLVIEKSGQMTVSFMDYTDERLEWMSEDLKQDKVTHWMKLPEPPKV